MADGPVLPNPSQAPASIGRDLPLDGLRGLCAALVFYAHAFAPTTALDPRWAPPAQFWWFNLGYAAVMMFFVLSGYVIGLTTTGPATGPAIRRYLGRRALRLLPVNTVAVLLAWALQPANDGRTVLANLLFLQNSIPYPGSLVFDLLPNNTNLWSLNYEVVYYLAFIPLWLWVARLGWVWLGLIALACAAPVGIPGTTALSHYACGGLYWFAGYAIARLAPPIALGTAARGTWPAALLGAYALWTLAPLRNVIVDLEWYGLMGLTPASLHRIDFLPACVWCLLAVSGRALGLGLWLGRLTLALATAGVGIAVWRGPLAPSAYVATLALLGAWWLRGWQPGTTALARLAPLGGVSFGLYAFALPIQFAVQRLWPGLAGTPLTFVARLAILTAVTLGLAWLVERRLTPWLRRRQATRSTVAGVGDPGHS